MEQRRRRRIRRAVYRALLAVGACLLLALAARGWWLFAWAGPNEVATIPSGEVRLEARLVLPQTEPPYPAVVLLHGSGPETYGLPGYRLFANAFVREGFAVLLYDKRGAGGSSGDFEFSTYADFVDDAVAAVRWLRARPEVDPARVGLVGTSEGGWLTPEVAVRSGGVAFVVNKCGPPLPWIDTVAWELENDLGAEGFDAEQTRLLVDARKEVWRYTIDAAALGYGPTIERRRELERRIEALREDPELARSGIRLPPWDAAGYARRANRYAYDPTPFLLDSSFPALYVLAGRDINVPAEASIRQLQALRAEGRSGLEHRLLPDEGHSLGRGSRFWHGGYPKGLLAEMARWAREKATRPSQGASGS